MGYWINGTVTGTGTARLELQVYYSHYIAADEAFNGSEADEVDPHEAMDFLDESGVLASQFGHAYDEIMEELRDNYFSAIDISDQGRGVVKIEVDLIVEIEREFDIEDDLYEKITCWDDAFRRMFQNEIGPFACARAINDLDLGSGVFCNKDRAIVESAEFEGEGEDGEMHSLSF